MTERWWAPQRPTVEPDAVVLAMLEPGDLGAAFMAAHRAGAAAIETVSKGVLPSEAKLVGAMVTARRNVAGKVVDSISKSLDGSYAGLLVRDVLDDAEQAALSVYRSAVSKGVSPPAAADRAAAVYGVPASQLGKYMTLATDPRVNPVTLTDAADRALLTYASRLAESEVQTISKADPPRGGQAYEEWDPREHPRDAAGQFARAPASQPPLPPKVGSIEWLREQLRLGTGEPQRVADIAPEQVEEKVEEKPARRVQRVQRKQRVQRVQRQPRQQSRAEQRSARERGPQERGLREHALIEAQLLEAQAQYQAELREDTALQVMEDIKSKALTRTAAPIPELMELADPYDTNEYQEMKEPLTLVANSATSGAFAMKLFDQNPQLQHDTSRMIFRMGHLLDVSNNPENSQSEDVQERIDHESKVAVAQALEGPGVYADPTVEVIHPEDQAASRLKRSDYNKQRRLDEVTTSWMDPTGHRQKMVDRQELNHVFVMPMYYKPGDLAVEDVLIHYGDADTSTEHRRPHPSVDEFVIVSPGSEAPLGLVEGVTQTSEQHKEYKLDPNQVYELINNPAGPRQIQVLPDQLWDPVHHIVVNRWYIQPISEYEADQILGGDVEKADDQAFLEAEHPRNAAGRFVNAQQRISGITVGQQLVPVPVETPTEEVEQKPVERVRRTARVRRVQRVQRPQQQTSAPREAQLREKGLQAKQEQLQEKQPTATPFEQAQTRARLRTQSLRVKDDTPELPVLSDAKNYKVMKPSQWTDFVAGLADVDINRMHDRQRQVPLNSYVRRIFEKHNDTHADSITFKMAGNIDSERTSTSFKVVRNMPVRDARNLDKLADAVEHIWATHPEAERIEMVRRNNVIEMSINVEPIPHQSIIEYDPDDTTDPDEKLYLSYVGEFKARELGIKNSHGDIEALVAPTGTANAQNVEGVVLNSPVHLYRISTRRYRVTN